MNSVESALEDILKGAMDLALDLGGRPFAAKIKVVWNARMRSTAGRAHWPTCRIELNPKLLLVDLEQVRRTLLHELAHLLAYHRAKGRRIQPHGQEWRLACVDLGIPGEKVTHNLPLPRQKQRRHWAYHCPVCLEKVERVRRMQGKQACYSCCKLHNGGNYHAKFCLIEEKIEG